VAIVQNGENVANKKPDELVLFISHCSIIPLLCPKIQMEKNTIAFRGYERASSVFEKWVNGRMYYSYFYFDVFNSFKKATIL
jgi:hypothetical protein